jgi:hypothetical protein
MSRPVDELIQSILDDFAVGNRAQQPLEAKTLFRLLNCCLPPKSEMDKTDQPAKSEGKIQ